MEESFAKLEEIIASLEKEDVSLEAAFEYYKSGVELLRRCSATLDTVEKKVMKLNEAGELDEFQ